MTAEIKQFPNKHRVAETMLVAHDIAFPLLDELAQKVATLAIKRLGDDDEAPYVLGWMVALAKSLVIAAHLAGTSPDSLISLIRECHDDLYGDD